MEPQNSTVNTQSTQQLIDTKREREIYHVVDRESVWWGAGRGFGWCLCRSGRYR